MNRQYISDIITEDEISKWKNGNRILICSQTGSGKSELIKTNLYNHCKVNNKKILLMSNRNLLKNQNIVDIAGKTDIIKAHNYQEFETRVLGGINIEELFQSYNYIVYDESHYFFSDAQFSKNTSLLMQPIKLTPKNKIFIFMTATPDALIDYQPDYDFTYNLSHDYSYIKDVYFYNKSTLSSVVESIIKKVPLDEKLLYFGSRAKDILELSNKFENSAFICSKSHVLYDQADQATIEQIVNESKFESRLLFSTKILDNGVNLKDEQLKHIIIDIVDPITFIQIFGRKRCLNENDRVTLYVRNYHDGNIFYIINDFDRKIEIANDFTDLSKREFNDKYNNKVFDGLIDNDGEINLAKYQHYITQRRLMKHISDNDTKEGYKIYICKLLDYDIKKTKNANFEFEKLSMLELLQKYVGFKMFKDEQTIFKELFFGNIFVPKKTNYTSRGLNAANGILEEDNLKYLIYSRREKKGTNRDKMYWIVESKL